MPRSPSCLRDRKIKLQDFWALDQHDIPEKSGAYVLMADRAFVYPQGHCSVFYVGQASNLRSRLREHLKYAQHVRNNSRRERWPLYWPRYEYAGAFGMYYATVLSKKTEPTAKLESRLLAEFARRHKAFPVANGAGSWSAIRSVFAIKRRKP